jgi:peptide/nickel transport system ATP-binding protein
MALLDIVNLTVDFSGKAGVHHVLKQVGLRIDEGEIVGLIGESGSGKSTLALTVLDLNRDHRSMSGAIRFKGEDLTRARRGRIREIRGRRIGFVPQSAMNALDPLVPIKGQFLEMIRDHMEMPRARALALINDSLSSVGIDPGRATARPYEFSGGQRQRLMIAMATLLSPELIIADEPTTALDATVQMRIIELMKDMSRQKNMAMLVISHDLRTISRICDRIYIMYAGRVVEEGTRDDIIDHPGHPYTAGLLRSKLQLTATPSRVCGIPGNPPSTLKVYSGCEFYDRCDRRADVCMAETPPACRGRTRVACHREGRP